MKLLFDHNLSPRLVRSLADTYPGSTHIRDIGLQTADDEAVWAYAAQHGFVIVSKDADFHQRSLVFGHPPKLIFLRVGNCSTSRIAELLRSNYVLLSAFDSDPNASILVLP